VRTEWFLSSYRSSRCSRSLQNVSDILRWDRVRDGRLYSTAINARGVHYLLVLIHTYLVSVLNDNFLSIFLFNDMEPKERTSTTTELPPLAMHIRAFFVCIALLAAQLKFHSFAVRQGVRAPHQSVSLRNELFSKPCSEVKGIFSLALSQSQIIGQTK
jgi:hypothetical protein